jgi:DHA2 family multidrug resistance protein
MLQRRTQYHQSQLMEHVNSLSLAYQNAVAGTQLRLVAAGSTVAHAAAQAQGMIYGTVQRQAIMLAFIDNFKLLGVVFFAVIPVLLLLKRPRGKPAGDVPVH